MLDVFLQAVVFGSGALFLLCAGLLMTALLREHRHRKIVSALPAKIAADLHYQRARLLSAHHHDEKAQSEFDRVLKLDPSHAQAAGLKKISAQRKATAAEKTTDRAGTSPPAARQSTRAPRRKKRIVSYAPSPDTTRTTPSPQARTPARQPAAESEPEPGGSMEPAAGPDTFEPASDTRFREPVSTLSLESGEIVDHIIPEYEERESGIGEEVFEEHPSPPQETAGDRKPESAVTPAVEADAVPSSPPVPEIPLRPDEEMTTPDSAPHRDEAGVEPPPETAVHAFRETTESYTTDEIPVDQPEEAEDFNRRGRLYFAKGQYQEAIEDFTRAIGINPDFDDAYLNRGRAYATLGRNEEALIDFRQAMQAEPELPSSFKAVLEGDGRQADADQLTQLLTDIDQGEAYNKRGESYIRKNLFGKAIADFSRAIEKNPRYIPARINRARALLQKGRIDAALADLEYVLHQRPKDAEAHILHGEACFQQNRFQEAVAAFSKAIEVNPEHSDAFLNRGRALRELGRVEEALLDFSQAVRSEPKQFYTYIDGGTGVEEIQFDAMAEEALRRPAPEPSPDFHYDLVIEPADGGVEEASLVRQFLPEENAIEVVPASTLEKTTYSLADICCIRLLHLPGETARFGDQDLAEEIETTTRRIYQVTVPQNQDFETGFFARLTDRDAPHQYLFFTFIGLRSRHQLRPVGEILLDRGLISQSTMSAVLEEQRQLKECRFGDILCEHKKITREKIDRVIEEALQSGRATPRTKVGEILVNAGIITWDEVEQVLHIQAENRKKRIGALLMERGLVKEEDILAALATKHGLRYVDLENRKVDPAALAAVPAELARELRILPVEFRHDRLLVATGNPTDPMPGDILRSRLETRIELAVSSPGRIEQALDVHYPSGGDAGEEEGLIGKNERAHDSNR